MFITIWVQYIEQLQMKNLTWSNVTNLLLIIWNPADKRREILPWISIGYLETIYPLTHPGPAYHSIILFQRSHLTHIIRQWARKFQKPCKQKCLSQYSLLQRKWSVAGILRYCTDWFMILHELVHAFPMFVKYHELILVVSRNPCHTTFFSKRVRISSYTVYSTVLYTCMYSLLATDLPVVSDHYHLLYCIACWLPFFQWYLTTTICCTV